MNAPRSSAVDELASGPEKPARRRRLPPRVARGLAVAAAVVAAALLAPDLLSSQPSGPPDTVQPTPSASPSASPTKLARIGPRAWPTRGNLRGDEVFLSDVLKHVRRDHRGADSVLFAAGLPEGDRLALVAVGHGIPATPADETAGVLAVVAWAGQSVQEARVEEIPGLTSIDALVGWAGRASDGRVYSVILGRPAPLEAEVSALINYHPDGSASRDWKRVVAPDGVAAVDLGTRVDPTVAVRPAVEGSGSVPILVAVSEKDRQPGSFFEPRIDDIEGLADPSYAGPDPITVPQALSASLHSLVDVAAADRKVLWSGRLDRGRGVLLRARSVGGATFHVFIADAARSGDRQEQTAVRRMPFSDADLMPWIENLDDPDRPVLLVNPSGAGTAAVEVGGGDGFTVRIGPSGVAKLDAYFSRPQLAGSTIMIRSPDGRHVVTGSLPSLLRQDLFVTN